jgi:hypothetical protein
MARLAQKGKGWQLLHLLLHTGSWRVSSMIGRGL